MTIKSKIDSLLHPGSQATTPTQVVVKLTHAGGPMVVGALATLPLTLEISDQDTTPIPPTPVATTVEVTPSTFSGKAGTTTQLSAVVKDQNGAVMSGQSVVWASSNSSVATVNASGLVSLVAAGSVGITATCGTVVGASSGTVTAAQPPQGCTLLTDWSVHTEPALAKPTYLQSVIDPVFKSKITRISDDPGKVVSGISGSSITWPSQVGPNYPKDPAWTADQKLLLLKFGFPNSNALFLDGDTYQPLFFRPSVPNSPGGGEWRLHPTLPDIAVALAASTGAVLHWNVRSNQTTTKYQGPGSNYTGFSLMNEGNLSRDGRYLGVCCTRKSDNKKVAFRVDIDNASKGPDCDLSAYTGLDWAGISPLGTYLQALDSSSGNWIIIFDAATGAKLNDWGKTNTYNHQDLTVNAAGEEVNTGLTGGSYSGHILMRRLPDGAITDLTNLPMGTRLADLGNHHVGARNQGTLGGPANGPWMFFVGDTGGGTYPFDNSLQAVALDATKRTMRYCHHRCARDGSYNMNPMAVASPDGKRMVYRSNWGATANPLGAYVVDVRDICP